MEVLKLFPSIVLDLVSKILPGLLFLVVLTNAYVPVTEVVTEYLANVPSDGEKSLWYKLILATIAAYVIGIFLAILSNKLDSFLIKKFWHSVISEETDKYIYSLDKPDGFENVISSYITFERFIDHSRSMLSIGQLSSAITIEKYRTAFRFFFGLWLASLLSLFTHGTDLGWYIFMILLLSFVATLHSSFRYLCKSIQYYSFQTKTSGVR